MTRLEFIHRAPHPKGCRIKLHEHRCCEIVYYVHGSGTTEIGGQLHAFKPHTFAWIPPHCPHNEHYAEDGEVLFIGFRQHSELAELFGHNGIYADDAAGTIQAHLLRMTQEYAQQQYGFMGMLDMMIGELGILLRRHLSLRKENTPQQEKLVYVRNYMDEHFRQKQPIASLAEMCGYSYDRFRHLFKETTGVAPQQYLLQKRMQWAADALLHTSHPVSDIAYEAGFSSDAQFCSMFKRETGKTPTIFRQSKQNSSI